MEHNHHHHDHHHHHHNHGHAGITDPGLKRTYIAAIALNLGFVAIEAIMGILHGSVGLLSDAGHNLSDVFSLILALIAFGLMTSHARTGYTYGFRKCSVLISLTNAIILLVAVGAILIESIERFRNPVPVNGTVISLTAGVGIIVNGMTTIMLMRRQEHDLNAKGAYMHMLADTLVSIGVVVSGFIISISGWTIMDPIISSIIAVIILAGTWNLLKESVRMSIDAVPEGIDQEDILEAMEKEAGEGRIHHVHIWPISTTETALIAHIVVDDLMESEEMVSRVKSALAAKGISHSTIEVETGISGCTEGSCC